MVVEETEDSPALTPEGNAALVDDFGGNKPVSYTHLQTIVLIAKQSIG